MDTIEILCPSCGSIGKGPRDHKGRALQCKKCRTRFVIPISGTPSSTRGAEVTPGRPPLDVGETVNAPNVPAARQSQSRPNPSRAGASGPSQGTGKTPAPTHAAPPTAGNTTPHGVAVGGPPKPKPAGVGQPSAAPSPAAAAFGGATGVKSKRVLGISKTSLYYCVVVVLGLSVITVSGLDDQDDAREPYRYLIPQGADSMTVVNLKKMRESEEFGFVTDINGVANMEKHLIGKLLGFGRSGLKMELEGVDSVMWTWRQASGEGIAVFRHSGDVRLQFDGSKVTKGWKDGYTVWESKSGTASVASDDKGSVVLGSSRLVDEVTRRSAERRVSTEYKALWELYNKYNLNKSDASLVVLSPRVPAKPPAIPVGVPFGEIESVSRGVKAAVAAFSLDGGEELRISMEHRDAAEAEEKIELITYLSDNLRVFMKGPVAENPILMALKIGNIEAMFLFEKWFGSVRLSRRGDTASVTSRVPRKVMAYLLANAEKQSYEMLNEQDGIVKVDDEYERLIESGKGLLARNQFTDAARVFERAKSLKPNADEPDNLLAEVDFQKLIHEGQEALSAKDFELALERFALALQSRPVDEQARLGQKEAEDGMFKSLVAAAKQSLGGGDLDTSEDAVRQALNIRPDSPEASSLLRDVVTEQGRVNGNVRVAPEVEFANKGIFIEKAGLVSVTIKVRNISNRALDGLNAVVEFGDPRGPTKRYSRPILPRMLAPGGTGTIAIQVPKNFVRYRVLSVRTANRLVSF